jgi:hypothetical protein
MIYVMYGDLHWCYHTSMRHLSLRSYMTITGRRDLAGRLPENRALEIQHTMAASPDHDYWAVKAKESGDWLISLLGMEIANRLQAELGDDWTQKQSWMHLWIAWNKCVDLVLSGERDPLVLARSIKQEPARTSDTNRLPEERNEQ